MPKISYFSSNWEADFECVWTARTICRRLASRGSPACSEIFQTQPNTSSTLASSVGSPHFRCCSFLLCSASSEAIDQKLVDEHGIMNITHTRHISASSDLLVSNMETPLARRLEVLGNVPISELDVAEIRQEALTPFRK